MAQDGPCFYRRGDEEAPAKAAFVDASATDDDLGPLLPALVDVAKHPDHVLLGDQRTNIGLGVLRVADPHPLHTRREPRKERRLDAERWEKWDLGGGLRQLWQSHTPGAQPVAMPSTLESSRQVENNSIADRSTIANHKVNTLGMTVKSTTASKMQPIPPLRIEGMLICLWLASSMN